MDESKVNSEEISDALVSNLPSELFRVMQVIASSHRDNAVYNEVQLVGDIVEIVSYSKKHFSINRRKAYQQRRIWSHKDKDAFIEKLLKDEATLDGIIVDLCASYGVQPKKAREALKSLAHAVLGNGDRNISDNEILNKLVLMLRDLDDAPTIWKATVWLQGIWVPGESVICGDLILRQPTADDLSGFVSQTAHDFGFKLFEDHPSSILEFKHRSSKPSDVQREIERIIETLRLYRLGSVRAVRSSYRGETILRASMASGYMLGNTRHTSEYSYDLGQSDADHLQSFVVTMLPLVSRHPTDSSAVEPISMALKRYREALLAGGAIESRIALAISCLEALFLKAKERSELSHRLSQRAAALLKYANVPPVKAYRELVRAYDVRSTFVHGSPMADEYAGQAGSLAETILEYARLAIVIFMQTQSSIGKDELIAKLESSLLEDKPREKIGSLMAGVVGMIRLPSAGESSSSLKS